MTTLSIRTLIEPGQTPSGFGLALHERHIVGEDSMWSLRPLSPCCGAFIEHGPTMEDDLHCGKCATFWQAYASDCRGTIGNDVPLTADTTIADQTIARWIARIMQFPNPEKDHDVKVYIAWD